MIGSNLQRRCRWAASAHRRGYTLLELIIASSAGALVVAGLASSLVIASKALVPDAPATADANRGALALSQLTGDLRHALRFTERTATAVTFTVPDRNGDSSPETIRYSWAGTAGSPLLYQHNGGTAVTLAANVQDFKLSAITRLITEETIEDPANLVIFESFAEAKLATAGAALAVPVPAGVAAGNLLVAAVAVDGSAGNTLAMPAGWTLLARPNSGGQVQLAVWWRIASASEPSNYAAAWTGNRQAYGWMMRFSGNHQTTPINAFSSSSPGTTSAAPSCPTVTTTVPNALILRIGGFDDNDITVDSAGIAGYTTITVDRSNTGSATTSGGAAYANLSAVGSSGTASFALTAAEEYVTFTVALSPD